MEQNKSESKSSPLKKVNWSSKESRELNREEREKMIEKPKVEPAEKPRTMEPNTSVNSFKEMD